MPLVYRCDICGAVTDDVIGWLLVGVTFSHYDPNLPTTGQPTGRMLDYAAPDLFFDKIECRDVWCAKSDVTPPPPPVAHD